MSLLSRHQTPVYVQLPEPPQVEPLGDHLFEVSKTTDTARCHHSAACLTPLRVGELVVPVGRFYALLDHIDTPPGNSTPPLTGGGVPKRL